MRVADIHPAIREAVGCHEGLRKLGFSASDIWVGCDGRIMFVALRTQGKEFTICTGSLELDHEKFSIEWDKVGEAVRTGKLCDADLNSIWTASMPYLQPESFVGALLAKGFRIPKALSKLN